jgi:hypothetical protein
VDNRPNVDFSQLRAFLFCRKVVRDDDGVTLVGVHDTRFAKHYPVKYAELFLYVSLEALRLEPLQLEVHMRLPNGEVRIMARSRSSLDESLVVTSEIPCAEFSFEAPGRYSFALYANGRLIGVTPLDIVDSLETFFTPPQRPKRN